jgi:GR25 family glycosyltransferase involved in LPS biosynthesis
MLTPYIISLSQIPSSNRSSIDVFDSLVTYGFDPVLFEGTYGNDADSLFNKENRQIHHTHSTFADNIKLTSPGVKGCFMSHYRLWQLCVDKNEPVMIFEDDVIFHRNYESVDFLDVLVLSINYDWKISKKYSEYLENTSKNSYSFNPALSVMPGCSGYIIKPHAARRLVKEYSNSYLPADLAINSSICKIEMHSRLMGRSKTIDEKESLTRSRAWV